MTAACINEVRVAAISIKLLKREHADLTDCMKTDYAMIANDPRAHAIIAFLGYDLDLARQRFDRAVEAARASNGARGNVP